MTDANAVPGFVPSVHGLHFANRWESGPTIRLGLIDPRLVGIGDASAGLCGGMAWLVREWFVARRPIPAVRTAPPNGTPLFRALVRRQILSLRWLSVPIRFWLAALTVPAIREQRTREEAWPRIRSAIDDGRLPIVGLVRHHGINPMRLDRDHQVLAFAYAVGPGDGAVTIRLYDPNWPDRDDVTLTLSPDGFVQSTGEPLLGVLALD